MNPFKDKEHYPIGEQVREKVGTCEIRRHTRNPSHGYPCGGDIVVVTGVSQGKGFSGTHKRHNFALGPKTHGSMNYRAPGSIGSVDAARVFKGQKMPGHMGVQKTTMRGLEVVRVDAERKLLLVKGNVPGHRNSVVLIRDNDQGATF